MNKLVTGAITAALATLAATAKGWVPEWAWDWMPWLSENWDWLGWGIAGLLVWRLLGWPGLVALAAAFGWIKRGEPASVPRVVHEDHEDPISPAPRPRKSLRDAFKK